MGDPQISAAALLGLGEARYRTDDDEGALANWPSITKLPDTSSTYPAWRHVAAAQVRAGDLRRRRSVQGSRSARPDQDKAEIASRLGWLSKETRRSGRREPLLRQGPRRCSDDHDDEGDHRRHRRDLAHGDVTEGWALVYQALWLDKALRGGGRVLATVDRDPRPRPREHLPSRVQHVGVVGRRPAGRALVRPDPFPGLLSRVRCDRLGRQLRIRW